MNKLEYPFSISILQNEEGGGYLIEFPDLPGCVSDGDTIDEAIANGKDALSCWIETAQQHGDEIPLPYSSTHSSEFVLNGPEQKENPLGIDSHKIIHQYEPLTIAPMTWEFHWSVTTSTTI